MTEDQVEPPVSPVKVGDVVKVEPIRGLGVILDGIVISTPTSCPFCKRDPIQTQDGNIKPHRPKRGPVDERINTKACKRTELREYVCNGAAVTPKPVKL